ncbi:hypothetical protein TD95_003633 [Thielaviopsis punctulata]|uniref:Cytochrome P450 n=1 Tax=Thielaviopsis punctulata TaxID=72032 RepID=A0A0F4ZL11_9PEZI|nr:hypothetical protein TD95_003633 [Thielaviopsis punctulata]
MSILGYEDMELQLPEMPTIISGCRNIWWYAVIVAACFLYWIFTRAEEPVIDIPVYTASKAKWMFSAETLIKDSYNKHLDRPYQIHATEGLQVLIPPRMVSEIKGLPEDVLSAGEAIAEVMQTPYTHFTASHNTTLMTTIIKTKLGQNIARLTPQLRTELEHITATELPPCCDWTPIVFQPFALRAIARISGRVFVGPDINRKEAWLNTSINYAVHVFLAVVKLQLFPAWLRPYGKFLVSELGQIKRDEALATALLRPVIEDRLQEGEFGSGEKAPDDLIQWFMDTLPESDRADVAVQAKLQLIVAAAAIHTTTNLLTDCMYDLAARPEVQEMLREEAMAVLEVEGGWCSKDSLLKLRKMDSFIKEVQRLSGNITSFIRKVVKPINLSDGTHLPSGTKILAAQSGISHDPRFFHDPSTLDPLRFYKLREAFPRDANRWQFTALNETSLNFGAGRHACPGRFLAANEVKLCLAYFLINYDIALRQDEQRPKPFIMVMTKVPDPKAEVLLRRREKGCVL